MRLWLPIVTNSMVTTVIDIETTSTVVDTSYYNDLSTNEGAEHNIVTVSPF